MANTTPKAPDTSTRTLPRELNPAELQQAGGGRRMETEKDPVFVIIGGSGGR